MPSASGASGWIRWALAAVLAFAMSAALVLAGLWPSEGEPHKTRKLDIPAEIVACAADDDCVLVDRIGCCSCDVGGGRWAVHRDQQDRLRLFLKKSCRNQPACIQIDACARDLRAVCRNQLCVAEPYHG